MSESFVDPELPILRRSELERYTVCPRQAVLIDGGRVNAVSAIAEIGQAVHDAYSEAISYYISTGGVCNAGDLQKIIMESLSGARADLKVEAVEAARRSAWKWASWLYDLKSPARILRYDGGDAGREGQLSVREANYFLSAEVDCLLRTESTEELDLRDWKTGWKEWNAEDVRASFQFRFYAALIFRIYRGISVIRVRIWNARYGYWSSEVEFRREEFSTLDAMIHDAVSLWQEWSGKEDAPAWPTSEKCRICDCAAVCDSAGWEAHSIATDPSGFVDRMAALDQQAERMKAVAKDFIRERGLDHIAGTEFNFGIDKPVSNRKKVAQLYERKED